MTTPIEISQEAAPCCAHTRVSYVRIDNPDGTCSDSWQCNDCQTKFWPEAFTNSKTTALEEEIAELKKKNRNLMQVVGWDAGEIEIKELLDERDSLQAEVERLKEENRITTHIAVQIKLKNQSLRSLVEKLVEVGELVYCSVDPIELFINRPKLKEALTLAKAELEKGKP